jgi:NAD-dependent DNA ligase
MDINKQLKSFIVKNKITDPSIFTLIENNINTFISEINNPTVLAVIINYAKDKYFNGESVISDIVYDKLIDKMTALDPSNKILSDVGYTIDIINKVNLPYHMGSMNKFKPDRVTILDKWKEKFKGPYLISNKLDGVSAMLIVQKNGKMKLYTRGDGKIGSDISHLIQYLNIINSDNLITYINENNLNRIVLRGELIMPINIFYSKYKDISANPRNFVSGQINAKKINSTTLADINLVFYEIIEPLTNIDIQYSILTTVGLKYSPFELMTINKLTAQTLSTDLKNRKETSIYEIDGIVISDINKHELNEDGNPEYSIAFKETLESNIVDATVEYVEWNISKDGYLKPRVKITPINLSGVQITYVTAHNGKYVYDNKIGPGTIIKITRSGDVIPYIVKVDKPAKSPQMPPKNLGKWEWNDSGVDIILESDIIGKDQLIKILTYFTKYLNIKNIDESTFKSLVDANIIKNLFDIFYLDKNEILKLDGFQEKKTNKILNEINSGFDRMHLVDLMIASNIFGHGIGERKIKKIMSVYPDILLHTYKPYIELIKMIDDIPGFDNITAKQFILNLDKFNEFLNKVPNKIKNRLLLDTIPKKKPKSKINLSGIKIVFTGFRNKEWADMITEYGGEIVNTVSKNTSLLICTDIDENSSKINKAKELNIKIVLKDDFLNYIKQNYNL